MVRHNESRSLAQEQSVGGCIGICVATAQRMHWQGSCLERCQTQESSALWLVFVYQNCCVNIDDVPCRSVVVGWTCWSIK